MKKIELVNVKYDGYERLYKIILTNDSERIMFAYSVEPDEYIESGFYQFDSKKIVEAKFFIEWVREVNLSVEKQVMILQDIENSSHVHCIGIVEKIIEDDSFTCNLGDFGTVIVELEKNNRDIHENMKVEFTGNLSVEINKTT
ncbi:MAG: hypothetical protein JEZ00_18965 [Anaerolineaceae bacterium]|nr:hypothetical protein [Anaerolineaceae bacterium]